MSEEKLRGMDFGWHGDPDTDWMWDIANPERRERIDKMFRETVKNLDFPQKEEPIIISTANPSRNFFYDNFVNKKESSKEEYRPIKFFFEECEKLKLNGT